MARTRLALRQRIAKTSQLVVAPETRRLSNS
jgi:hypothetical protein